MATDNQPFIIIEENAPRDGIQNESAPFSVEERIELIHRLVDAGLTRIQIGSFVHERLVPQMAGTEAVFESVSQRRGVVFTALVLNEKGLARAMACSMEHVALFVSASETHSRRNSNMSVEESVRRAGDLMARARGRGMTVQAGVMNAFGCRDEGPVPQERVLEILERLVEAGPGEISLADTAGVAHPLQVERMVHGVRAVSTLPLSLHFHDTYGFGLANVYAAWRCGVTRFDACCGGLGGCPFIADAAGNVATEDVALMMSRMGVGTGIHLPRLIEVTRWLEHKLGRALPARARKVLEVSDEFRRCETVGNAR